MPESQAKGDIFHQVLDQVVKKWGMRGLEVLGHSPGEYKIEQWYDFSELCQLLSDVKRKLGNNSPLTIYQLAFSMMKADTRWQEIFDEQDPAEIFISTKRQEAQYRGGTFRAEKLGNKHVKVELVDWNCEPVWYDFYRGRLQAVLELTGRTGVVHLMPDEGSGTRVYDIKWG